MSSQYLSHHHAQPASRSTSRHRSISPSPSKIQVPPPQQLFTSQRTTTGHSHHKIVVIPGFTCDAWTSQGVKSPIPITTFGSGASSRHWWRILALLNFAAWPFVLLHKFYVIFSRGIILPWMWAMRALGVKGCVPNLRHGFDQFILRCLLRFFSHLSDDKWRYFWALYVIFVSSENFYRNFWHSWYLQALALPPPGVADIEYIFMFIDHGQMVPIPCSAKLNTDKALLSHISTFYYLTRMRALVVEFLGGKAVARIDYVKLLGNRVPGERLGTLDLGFYGDAQREVALLKDSSGVEGSNMLNAFRPSGLLATEGHHLSALNVVRTYSASRISFLILLPTILSIAVAVAWPVVAVFYYGAEVQASVQTSFTIASYVVTAGALLVALVAFAGSMAVDR